MSGSAKSQIDTFVISKVKEKRETQEISQTELANYLDVSPGFIGMVESPRFSKKYSVDQLNRIAILLKCSIKDFFPDHPINK